MGSDRLPLALTKLVAPRAMRAYAVGSGWVPTPGINGSIVVYHRPESPAQQLVVPLDESFEDYGESVAEVVRKLALYDAGTETEVLNHLLLPPADVIRLREISPEAETGTLSIDQAVSVLEGARRLLSSTAHSILHPQPFHPRLSRADAEQFVRDCRVGQTERGSFTMTIACPLNHGPRLLYEEEPLARQVTRQLLETLHSVVSATDAGAVAELVDPAQHPLLSANFCEALLMLRPVGDRSRVNVGVTWSKSLAPPASTSTSPVELTQDCFDAVEYIAPRLRAAPQPKQQAFVGYVDVLRGQPDADGRMAGEAVFSIVLDEGELIRVRTELTADDYQVAGDAHLQNEPVYFRGVLQRGARTNRVAEVQGFRRLEAIARSPK